MNEYWNFKNGTITNYSNEEILEIFKKSNLGSSIFLTVQQLKYLDNNLSILNKEKLKRCIIFLYMNSPTELSYEEYKYFYNKYKLYHLFVTGFSKMYGTHDEEYKKTDDIDPKIMLEYLKNLNDLIINLPSYSNINIEENVKTICILENRIVNKVCFDINTSYLKHTKKNDHLFYVPNEIIGLVDKKAVCRGYARIFRDACSMLGYEVICINGFDKNKNGHEWNQIKIGDNWFNCDITYDINNILSNMVPIFLLTDDKEFYATYQTSTGEYISHSDYLSDIDKKVSNTTIPRETINSYIFEENKKKKR